MWSTGGEAATTGIKAGELGGAIAAVEAAGRTVLYQTKQVVEAVAGTLNMVEARDEAYSFLGFDLDDAIILSEIINRGFGEDTLLVVRKIRLYSTASKNIFTNKKLLLVVVYR